MKQRYFSDGQKGGLRSSLANLFIELHDHTMASTIFDSYPKHRFVRAGSAVYIAVVPQIVTEITDYYATLLAGRDFVNRTLTALMNEKHRSRVIRENILPETIQEGNFLHFSLPALYFIEDKNPVNNEKKTVSCFVAGHHYARKPRNNYHFVDGDTVTKNISSLHPEYDLLAVLVVGKEPPYAHAL